MTRTPARLLGYQSQSTTPLLDAVHITTPPETDATTLGFRPVHASRTGLSWWPHLRPPWACAWEQGMPQAAASPLPSSPGGTLLLYRNFPRAWKADRVLSRISPAGWLPCTAAAVLSLLLLRRLVPCTEGQGLTGKATAACYTGQELLQLWEQTAERHSSTGACLKALRACGPADRR